MSVGEKVAEFHRAFGQPAPSMLTIINADRKKLRTALIMEELRELYQAMADNKIPDVADACADLVYVVAGTAIEYGIPFDAVFEEVHKSNMTKLGVDGMPIRRHDGKILKPDDWEPPNLRKVLYGK